MTHHIDLAAIHLAKGSGSGDNLCVMQWTARFAGEPASDHPSCTSPVLTAFCIAWNDGVGDEDRQKLIPFIPRLVGTAGDPEADAVRAWLATDWLVRVFTPAWLRRAKLDDEAAALEALPELTSSELAAAAQPIIDQAREKAAARDAARAAARDAAWDAARDAAWDAAWDAARAAAWDAARAAARAAAWDAARDAAWDAARDAAWDAAWDAARDAAWDAAKEAGVSATDTYGIAYAKAKKAFDGPLGDPLRETARELNDAALVLLDRMIDAKAAVPA